MTSPPDTSARKGVTPELEKMARAMCEAEGGDADECAPKIDWSTEDTPEGPSITYPPAWQRYVPAARACLATLLEPSEGVINRMTASISFDGVPPVDAPPDDDYADDMRRALTAAIRHILGEVG